MKDIAAAVAVDGVDAEEVAARVAVGESGMDSHTVDCNKMTCSQR